MSDFQDLLGANKTFAAAYRPTGRSGKAARGLAVVTCIDSRIDPLSMLGLVAGDAKILRNAGARVTDDVLRGLILATHLLDVTRIALVQHTDCRMASATQDEIAATITEARGTDASGIDYLSFSDQPATLAADLERLRAHPLIPPQTVIEGFVYDVHTGVLEPRTR